MLGAMFEGDCRDTCVGWARCGEVTGTSSFDVQAARTAALARFEAQAAHFRLKVPFWLKARRRRRQCGRCFDSTIGYPGAGRPPPAMHDRKHEVACALEALCAIFNKTLGYPGEGPDGTVCFPYNTNAQLFVP